MNLWWTDVVHPTWREVSLTLIFLSFIILSIDNRLPTCIVCILRNNILLGEFLTLFILLFLDYLLVDLCIQCLHNKTLFRPISTVCGETMATKEHRFFFMRVKCMLCPFRPWNFIFFAPMIINIHNFYHLVSEYYQKLHRKNRTWGYCKKYSCCKSCRWPHFFIIFRLFLWVFSPKFPTFNSDC